MLGRLAGKAAERQPRSQRRGMQQLCRGQSEKAPGSLEQEGPSLRRARRPGCGGLGLLGSAFQDQGWYNVSERREPALLRSG